MSKPSQFTTQQKADALLLLGHGVSASAIAEWLDCSGASIYMWRKDRGRGSFVLPANYSPSAGVRRLLAANSVELDMSKLNTPEAGAPEGEPARASSTAAKPPTLLETEPTPPAAQTAPLPVPTPAPVVAAAEGPPLPAVVNGSTTPTPQPAHRVRISETLTGALLHGEVVPRGELVDTRAQLEALTAEHARVLNELRDARAEVEHLHSRLEESERRHEHALDVAAQVHNEEEHKSNTYRDTIRFLLQDQKRDSIP